MDTGSQVYRSAVVAGGGGNEDYGMGLHEHPPPPNLQPNMMDRIARVVGAKILPSVDHITRIAAAAAAGKDGLAAVAREEVCLYVVGVRLFSNFFVGVFLGGGVGLALQPEESIVFF